MAFDESNFELRFISAYIPEVNVAKSFVIVPSETRIYKRKATQIFTIMYCQQQNVDRELNVTSRYCLFRNIRSLK